MEQFTYIYINKGHSAEPPGQPVQSDRGRRPGMATRKKPPVSPAGGGPVRGRAIQPAPSAESPRLPQPGRTPAPFRSNTGKDAAGCAASYLGIPAAPHHRLQTAERAAAPTGHPDTESDRSTARARKAADEAEAMAATELRRRQKRRLHPKRCENHASCRKAKFFSYFCAIIIGKR